MSSYPQPPYDPYQPQPYGYGEPSRPGVVTWFTVLCVLMVLLNLLLAAVGVFLILADNALFQDNEDLSDPQVRIVMGLFYAAAGVVLAVLFLLPLFFPRRKWVWVYDLVLICLTLTNCICLPIAIPLLIFWLQQRTRVYFGFGDSPPPGAYTNQGYPEQQPSAGYGYQSYGTSPYPNVDQNPPDEPWRQ